MRELHWQVFTGDLDETTLVTVDHRYGSTPIALPGDQPVPETPLNGPGSDALVFHPVDGPPDGFIALQPVEEARIDRLPLSDVGLAVPVIGRLDGADDVESILLGEVPVALVLSGNGHDGAGPVSHEHIIGDVDRHPLVVHRVDGVCPRQDPGLAAFGHPLHI